MKPKIREIKTVRDLLRACNGDYVLFGNTIKNYLICKGGKLMTWEDWINKPHPLISETEDADFEVIEPKKLPQPNRPNSTVPRQHPYQIDDGDNP